jgi:Peptidase family M28
MWKKNLILVVAYILLCKCVSAENPVPVISNLRASAEPGSREIAVRYDLSAAADKNFHISFQLLSDEKESETLPCLEVYGDVGYPVKAGTDKLIICLCAEPFTDMYTYKVKLIIEGQQKPDIGRLTREVSLENIKNDISFLSVKRYFREDSLQLNNIVQKIGTDFTDHQIGLQKQEFNYAGHTATNLVGFLPGMNAGNKIFIIGAHWDAVKGSPGSDDNASGVAGMLEVMRVLSNYKFHHSIYFAAFDMEEEGLFGSKEFVKRLAKSNPAQEVLYINLDMIGYYSTQVKSQVFPVTLKDIFPVAYKEVSGDNFKGDFILNTMNENSESAGKYFDSCARVYVPDLQVVSLVVPDDGKIAPESFRSSDHASFWDANLKAISIGDTGDNRNFNYHSPADVIDEVDMTFVHRVVKALTTTLATLAEITNGIIVTAPVSVSSCKPDARIFGTSNYSLFEERP